MRERDRRMRRKIKQLREAKQGDIFGDKIEAKPEKVTIALINPSGLNTKAGKEKDDRLQETTKEYGIDILGLTEVNNNWSKAETHDNIWERTYGWYRQRKMATSYNSKQISSSQFQRGGTITLATEKMAGRTIEARSDKNKMGRWSWILLKGKEGKSIRAITMYRPCENQKDTGSLTTSRRQL